MTAADGTVSSYGGWNVSSVSQSGADSGTYNVTCDTALDSDCTMYGNIPTFSPTGFTGLPVPVVFRTAIGLDVSVTDAADRSVVEAQSSRVHFTAIGRSSTTAPAL